MSRIAKMMVKQSRPSKQYDSQQDDYVHNEKWSPPDNFFTLACALCKQVIPYHDRWVYSALFNGWIHASLLFFKWRIFQNLKCIFFLTICKILGHVKTVMYCIKRKWNINIMNMMSCGTKKKFMNYWTIILVSRKLWNYDTKECWWTTNQPFWSSYRHCR